LIAPRGRFSDRRASALAGPSPAGRRSRKEEAI